MAARSPASSPRLPSPPPIAEDQIGPTSPGVSLYEENDKFLSSDSLNNGASRRIRPGTKAEDMAEGPPVVEMHEIESAFPLTEHLKALHYFYTHPDESTTIQPVTLQIAQELTHSPPAVSRDIWLYELGRFLIQKTNAIIVALFQDDPPCSPQTCPEMRASEWQYLCAVHDPPKSCAAIDYCCHTLDWAATTLSSSKMFPSRLGLGSGPTGGGIGGDKVLNQQMKEIKNIFRRVYRIYAHAWFQHREMFWRVEGKTGLYVFFKVVCDAYGIIEPENYTIPAEAEGLEPAETEEQDGSKEGLQAPPQVLRRDQDVSPTSPKKMEDGFGLGDTTKRHRHTKSDFSRDPSAVIKEEIEEEDDEQHKEQDSETPASSSPKPMLGRQDTALRETPGLETDIKPEEAGDGDADLETPISEQAQEDADTGVASSDDIKIEETPVAPESEDEGDQTVVEVTAEGKVEEIEPTEGVVPELTASTELSQDQEPAAKADEASKSVGD